MSTQCITPFPVKDANKIQHLVPCGKCPGCVARRTSAWSFRLRMEGLRACSAYFVTFTYNTDHVPISENGYYTLFYKDMQDFFKRLRKNHSRRLHPIYREGRPGIKYYCAGEYGSTYNRPHYHAIIFNAHCDDICEAWRLNGRSIGDLHFGTVTGASIGYTLKYLEKKNGNINKFAGDDRVRERALMSKGLGENYITDATIRYHLDDLLNRVCHVIEDGKRVPMARYYKQKIYNAEQRGLLAGHFEQQARNAPPLDISPRDLVERHKAQFRRMTQKANQPSRF